jgi:hypothetical protein
VEDYPDKYRYDYFNGFVKFSNPGASGRGTGTAVATQKNETFRTSNLLVAPTDRVIDVGQWVRPRSRRDFQAARTYFHLVDSR